MEKMSFFTRLVTATVITVFLVWNPLSLLAQEKGTFKDSRDGRIYQWVKIGKKNWMAENLKFQTPTGSWVYNNDTANLKAYGLLYDHTTAMTACPAGWRMPTDADWALLIEKLGGVDKAGEKILAFDSVYKAAHPELTPDAKAAFTLFGGVRHADNTFTGVGQWGALWSATTGADGATNYLFAHGDKSISKSTNDKATAFGVRCVKK